MSCKEQKVKKSKRKTKKKNKKYNKKVRKSARIRNPKDVLPRRGTQN